MIPRRPQAPPRVDDTARFEAAVQLVDKVAHDLNNALLVIKGYSSVLRTSLTSPEQLADVDEIARAADHAATLTRGLLEIGHPPVPDTVASAGGLDQGTETILLVEDDKAVRDLVRNVLERAGYRVLPASRPSEAEVLLAEEQRVDLLLSDVVMPEMSGFELAARLRLGRPEMRTLFMSGNAYVASSSTHSDDELLKKPFEPGELAHAVRGVLDRPAVPA
jgi:CheY-like chemotaxis protein